MDVYGLSRRLNGKESTCPCRRRRRCGFDPGVGKILWSRKWQPLQYSCLENSIDRGALRVTVHGVTKSQTQLSNWAHVCTQVRVWVLTHTHTHTQWHSGLIKDTWGSFLSLHPLWGHREKSAVYELGNWLSLHKELDCVGTPVLDLQAEELSEISFYCL